MFMTERFDCSLIQDLEGEPIVEEDLLTRILSEDMVSQGCPWTRQIISPSEASIRVEAQSQTDSVPQELT